MHSVHFSCLQHVNKPSKFESEHEYLSTVYMYAQSCTRFYYLLWYEKYVAGMGKRLPKPYWDGPEVPVFDHKHDEIVLHNRIKAGV